MAAATAEEAAWQCSAVSMKSSEMFEDILILIGVHGEEWVLHRC